MKDAKYKDALEQLAAVRNYAAHDSIVSKTRFKKVVGAERVPSAGVWLKRQSRLAKIASKLKELAGEIENGAPY